MRTSIWLSILSLTVPNEAYAEIESLQKFEELINERASTDNYWFGSNSFWDDETINIFYESDGYLDFGEQNIRDCRTIYNAVMASYASGDVSVMPEGIDESIHDTRSAMSYMRSLGAGLERLQSELQTLANLEGENGEKVDLTRSIDTLLRLIAADNFDGERLRDPEMVQYLPEFRGSRAEVIAVFEGLGKANSFFKLIDCKANPEEYLELVDYYVSNVKLFAYKADQLVRDIYNQ